MQVAVRGRNHRPCRQWRVTISRPTPQATFPGQTMAFRRIPQHNRRIRRARLSGCRALADGPAWLGSSSSAGVYRFFSDGSAAVPATQPGSSCPPADRAPTGSCHSYEDHPPRRIGAVPRSIDRRAADRGRPGVRSTPRNSGDPGATWAGERSTFHDRAFGQLRYGGPPRRS
jgi:hypothetical protein